MLSVIEPFAFFGLSKLKQLFLNANQLKLLSPSIFIQTPNLKLLDLNQNLLNWEPSESFPLLERLDWIDLSENRMTHLSGNLLTNLGNITKLHLQNNLIESIDENAFERNTNLFELNLSYNRLSVIPGGLFSRLYELRSLDLSINPLIDHLPLQLFHDQRLLKSLNLTGFSISNINRYHFSRNRNLTHLYFSRFKYCLFAPQVRICHPSSDGVSSREHLLVYPILRVSVWIVALLTCLGNMTVITWRSVSRNEDAILSLFVKNLSFADLLMGVYLVSIGLNDIGFKDQYLLYAIDWMSSWKCSAIGFLAMTSSELSVLILTVVAIERYRSIAFSSRLLNLNSARLVMILVWVIALCIASYPLLMESSPIFGLSSNDIFMREALRHGATGYYGSNGLCFPLHIDDPYSSGWTYSAFVFLGVNLCAVLVMLILYTRMFFILNRDRSQTRPGSVDKHKEDVILALRFFFIVFTDCLCWLPIVVIKIIAFTSLTINSVTYAWVVVFILPINSAINPILYTMAAPTEMRKRLLKQMTQVVSKMSCGCCWLFCPSCLATALRRDSENSSTQPGVVIEVYDTDDNEDKVKRPSNGSLMSVVTMSTLKSSNCGSRRGSVAKSLLNPHSNQSTLLSNCSFGSVSPKNNSLSPLRKSSNEEDASQEDDVAFEAPQERHEKPKLKISIFNETSVNVESDPATASTIVSLPLTSTETLPDKPPFAPRNDCNNLSRKRSRTEFFYSKEDSEPKTGVTFLWGKS